MSSKKDRSGNRTGLPVGTEELSDLSEVDLEVDGNFLCITTEN